jgi:uncharacterized membrane protein YoaK (UPF0700 family)
MMEQPYAIRNLSLLLATIAGFCDTITFVTQREFSAHVTGNFIIFAYDVIKGADAISWIKLISFPVFILAVMAGGWIINKANNKCSILLSEGIILAATGVIMLIFKLLHFDSAWLGYVIVMPVVFSMGLQNAFGKLFSKETYGPTTMMTGNVTQSALDLREIIKSKFNNEVVAKSLAHQSYTIIGFLMGCLLGAIAGNAVGLSALLLPGLALMAYPKEIGINT